MSLASPPPQSYHPDNSGTSLASTEKQQASRERNPLPSQLAPPPQSYHQDDENIQKVQQSGSLTAAARPSRGVWRRSVCERSHPGQPQPWYLLLFQYWEAARPPSKDLKTSGSTWKGPGAFSQTSSACPPPQRYHQVNDDIQELQPNIKSKPVFALAEVVPQQQQQAGSMEMLRALCETTSS